MMKRSITRKGFTLVEVALAVAVGLIIIGGAVLGYNAAKDNASNSTARNRVLSAATIIEEYAAANQGSYPASASATSARKFGAMWKAKRPDDFNKSPWGGDVGTGTSALDGVIEYAPVTSSVTDSTAAATTTAGASATDTTLAAVMQYASCTSGKWAKTTAYSTQSDVTWKNYAVGIYDKVGNSWWAVQGGK